jgi:hypothetical protein
MVDLETQLAQVPPANLAHVAELGLPTLIRQEYLDAAYSGEYDKELGIEEDAQ